MVLLFCVACRTSPQVSEPTSRPGRTVPTAKPASSFALLSDLLEVSAAPQTTSLGEDDGSTVAMVKQVVTSPLGEWTRVPAPKGAHPVVCDLAWFQGAVWASFGNKTISTDGAQVHSWNPDRGWKLELNWDRGGAPGVTHEQSGQGISRLRVIGDKLYATDADAPNFAGFGITDAPLEGYVFVAGADGFGALGVGDLPPKDTLLVPLAFHVFDIIEYAGERVASGGTLAPAGSKSRYPGGLFVESGDGLFLPRFFPGKDTRAGVVRATFMHRFRGRLYIGFQNNERRARWDLGVLEGVPSGEASLVLGRVTELGGYKTRQFASDERHLYWIGSKRTRPFTSHLFQSLDGLKFEPVALTHGMGEAQDILAYDDTLLVLTDTGIHLRSGDSEFKTLLQTPVGSPFRRRDGFCSSPLLATPLGLAAGSTNGSGIYLSRALREP